MVEGNESSRTLTRDPEVLWATHQGRGLSWREGQGYGSPVAAFFFFKSRRMRRDKTPHSVDNPWSTQRGRRYQSSLSGPVVRHTAYATDAKLSAVRPDVRMPFTVLRLK